ADVVGGGAAQREDGAAGGVGQRRGRRGDGDGGRRRVRSTGTHTGAGHDAGNGVTVSREGDIRSRRRSRSRSRSEAHRHRLGRSHSHEGERTPGDDAEGTRGRRRPGNRPTARVRHREGLIREAAQVHIPEIHGRGWHRGKIDSRHGTRRGTGALVVVRVDGGDTYV